MPVELLPVLVLAVLGRVERASRLRAARRYRPARRGHREPVAVVCPVYREDAALFGRALRSWAGNDVAEIVCVIHENDTACIEVARAHGVRVIVTADRDKRRSLCTGWEAVTANLVALVDSDTVWARGLVPTVCAPFVDPTIGGVATQSFVLEPNTFWEEIRRGRGPITVMAAQTVRGQALGCLPGRTAVYRRTVLEQIGPGLVNQSFLGVRCGPGDDTRLSLLTLRAGYRTVLQANAHVWSRYPNTLGGLVRQRLRHQRNSWREHLIALSGGWIWQHPYLARCITVSAVLRLSFPLSTAYFIWLALSGELLAPAAVLAWWFGRRLLRTSRALHRAGRQRGLAFKLLAIDILSRTLDAFALLTIRRQGWLTRGSDQVT
ncbi:glycosyltransferase [Streptomyces sp. NPDC046261]|uniref:glycosyltransferase n=1 Tax=Streptomyces sp. NPDC046261 TaxID=3157200 RepID=UPI00340678C3